MAEKHIHDWFHYKTVAGKTPYSAINYLKCRTCGKVVDSAKWEQMRRARDNARIVKKIRAREAEANEMFDTRFKRFQEFKEDAPANAAGNAGVAGLGQPPGSKFGEPPGPAGVLGGYTSGKKRKHYDEDAPVKPRYSATNRRPVGKIEVEFSRTRSNGMMGRLETRYTAKTFIPSFSGTTRSGVESKPSPTIAGALDDLKDQLINRYFVSGSLSLKHSTYDQVLNRELDALLRSNRSVSEGFSPSEIEDAAEAVHTRWVENQKAEGHTEHKSPDGKEDYMVPYDELSHKSKEMDREAVRATISALKLEDFEGPMRIVKGNTAFIIMQGYDNIFRGFQYQRTPFTTRPMDAKVYKTRAEADKDLAKIREWIGWPEDIFDKTVKVWDASHLVGFRLTEETFAGHQVFEVDTDRWMKSRFGKNRYHRYSKYVGEDETGENIRQYGRRNVKKDIILKDQTTGAMTWFLRRKKSGQ